MRTITILITLAWWWWACVCGAFAFMQTKNAYEQHNKNWPLKEMEQNEKPFYSHFDTAKEPRCVHRSALRCSCILFELFIVVFNCYYKVGSHIRTHTHTIIQWIIDFTAAIDSRKLTRIHRHGTYCDCHYHRQKRSISHAAQANVYHSN